VNITEILVGINSSTDKTQQIVNKFRKRYNFVNIIESPKGKAFAWNALNKEALNDIRIFQDGDSIATKYAYCTLLSLLQNADIVGSCIEKKLINYNMFVKIVNFPKRHAFAKPKLNGCLYAFEYSVILRYMETKLGIDEMPSDIINEDAFLALIAEKVMVSDKVFTLVEAEKNLKEVIQRYVRIRQGRQQLKERYPNLFDTKLVLYDKERRLSYYRKLFHLADPVEKIIFLPMMMLKYLLFKHIYAHVNRKTKHMGAVQWK
jgi:glycosyltransferase involved in cell wall biosynthesis